MAFESSTATNYLDLLTRLHTFLTSHADLVAAGRTWAVERWTNGDELILRGPGLAGDQAIYVGLRAYEDVGADYYNWGLRGFTGYLASETFALQPGASPEVYVHLWNDSIPYWFVANGQRIVAVMKISTVYQALYLGYFLPYATPGQFPYPILAGGASSNSTWRWSVVSANHRHFTNPGQYCLRMRDLTGQWLDFVNWYQSGASEVQRYDRNLWPYGGQGSQSDDLVSAMRDAPGGRYSLTPIILNAKNPANNVYGELDGCYHVSGFGNAAENLITEGGVNHLVVQNVYRTSRPDYWALRLS